MKDIIDILTEALRGKQITLLEYDMVNGKGRLLTKHTTKSVDEVKQYWPPTSPWKITRMEMVTVEIISADGNYDAYEGNYVSINIKSKQGVEYSVSLEVDKLLDIKE